MATPSQKGENADKSSILIDWLLTPKELRNPPTLEKLATELGVTSATLRNWRKEPVFQREMTDRQRGVVRVDMLPAVIEALYRTAISGTPQQPAAAKLLLDFMEKVQPAKSIDVSALTPEELHELAMAALGQIKPADG